MYYKDNCIDNLLCLKTCPSIPFTEMSDIVIHRRPILARLTCCCFPFCCFILAGKLPALRGSASPIVLVARSERWRVFALTSTQWLPPHRPHRRP